MDNKFQFIVLPFFAFGIVRPVIFVDPGEALFFGLAETVGPSFCRPFGQIVVVFVVIIVVRASRTCRRFVLLSGGTPGSKKKFKIFGGFAQGLI